MWVLTAGGIGNFRKIEIGALYLTFTTLHYHSVYGTKENQANYSTKQILPGLLLQCNRFPQDQRNDDGTYLQGTSLTNLTKEILSKLTLQCNLTLSSFRQSRNAAWTLGSALQAL